MAFGGRQSSGFGFGGRPRRAESQLSILDAGYGFERPNAPISRYLDALEVSTLEMHGRAQFYCGLGGHARAQHGHIVGRRAPSPPSPRLPRTKHVLAKPSPQRPRGYVDPQLSCEPPPVLRLHVPIRGHFCVLRSRLLVITDFKRAVRAYQAYWRWPGPMLRPIDGCTAACARLHAVSRPRERFSHSRRNSCLLAQMPDPLPCGEPWGWWASHNDRDRIHVRITSPGEGRREWPPGAGKRRLDCWFTFRG